MMSIHPEGGGSAQDTRVSLINIDMVSGLISVTECGLISLLDEVGGRWWQEVHKVAELAGGSSANHVRFSR
jgi:hypothetical protein